MYTDQAPVDKVPDSEHVKRSGSTLFTNRVSPQRGKVEITCNKQEEVIR